jgi:hypothetical protein
MPDLATQLALLLLPGPIGGVLLARLAGPVTWGRGLLAAGVGQLVVTAMVLGATDLAIGCLGGGCVPPPPWKARVLFVASTLVPALVLGAVVIAALRWLAPGRAGPGSHSAAG